MVDQRSVLIRAVSALRRKTFLSLLKPQSRDPFATHLPILLGVSRLYSPKHILELGSGLFSTPTLLNRDHFPTVKTLHTIEDDRNWFTTVRTKVGSREGFRIEYVDSVPAWAAGADLSAYDLIFIDDSNSAPLRARSISSALERAAPNALVVVHDFENQAYRRAISPPWQHFTFAVSKPFTGVIWQQGDRLQELSALRTAIRNNRHLRPTDAKAWSEFFRDR